MEVQNKEDRTGCVDSIGQLVMLCERDGGIIEQMPDPDDYPQDKIDLTIADIKRYSVSLLRNEPNISGLIESYVHKLEEADARTKALMGGKGAQLPPEPEEDLPPDIFSDMYEENLHPDEPDVPLDDEEADAIKARMGLV